MEVACGGDVENPGFGARHGIPTYGCIALHVSGHRQKLKIAPYEAQATRLFIRNDNVCGRISKEAPSWFDALGNAMTQFWRSGVLPHDDLLLDATLVFVEMHMLVAHRRGTDVTETMALLDAIARAKHDERDELLNELSAIAAAGGLPGSDSVGDDA